jgi:histidinol-phosphate phosphatase family protein
VRNWSEFHFLPGAVEALAAFRARAPHVPVVVVTNQRGVALGRMSLADVEDVHRRMRAALRSAGADVDRVDVCPHATGTCDCRKPALGLFHQALAALPGVTARASVVVGDALNDMEAGTNLGARTCLVGEAGQRRRVRRAAAGHAIRIDLEADSLAALVAGGRLDALLAPDDDLGARRGHAAGASDAERWPS